MKSDFESMMPLSIEDIIQGIEVPVDVYIKLTDEKYVMVAKAGTKPVISQFKNYQDKEVHYVWVHTKDFYKLAHQSVQIAGMAVDRKELNDKIKTSFVTQAARSMFSQMRHMGLNLEVYNNARQVTETVVTLAENHKSFSAVLESLNNCSDALLAHSVAVSTVSTIIGTAMGFEKRVTLEKLALGGLLHDIGIKTLPKEVMNKPIALMSSDEIYLWETHSFKGAQLLQNLGIVGEDIIAIVLEHHENAVGQGFPSRIRDLKMHPLAKIVSLANAFCDMILPNINTRPNKNAREAVLYMELTLGTPFNKEAFRALKRIVDGPIDKKTRAG